MRGSPLTGLKDASTGLVNSLFPAGSTNGFVKLSIVPFGSNVKAFDPETIAEVGNSDEATRFANLGWLDQNGKSAVHWENWTKFGTAYPDITFKPKNRFELHANIGTKWTGCMETRPSSVALTDTAIDANGNNPTATQSQANTLYVPYFAPDNSDNNYMKDNNSVNNTNSWLCTTSNSDPYKVQDNTIFANTALAGDKTSMLCKYKGRIETTPQADTCVPDNNCSSASLLPGNSFANLIQHASATDGPVSRLPATTPSIADDHKSMLTLVWGNNNNNNNNDDDDDGGNNSSNSSWNGNNGNGNGNGGNGGNGGNNNGPSCTPTQTCTPNPPLTAQLTVEATSDTSSKGPNAGCDTPTVLPLTNDRAKLLSAINAQVATSRTNLAAGLLWGWKTISPNGPYAALTPDSVKGYNAPNNKKVIVMMTDGDHSMQESIYSTYGFYWNQRLGAKASNNQSYESYLDTALQTACTNAKAAGVTIYTIAYTSGANVSATSPMAMCASPGKFMTAADGAALSAKFQEIGNAMAGLHISR